MNPFIGIGGFAVGLGGAEAFIEMTGGEQANPTVIFCCFVAILVAGLLGIIFEASR